MKTSVETPVGEKTLGKFAARVRRLWLVDAHLPTLSTLPRLAPPVNPVVSHKVGLKTQHGVNKCDIIHELKIHKFLFLHVSTTIKNDHRTKMSRQIKPTSRTARHPGSRNDGLHLKLIWTAREETVRRWKRKLIIAVNAQTLPSPAAPCTWCGLKSYKQHISSSLLTFAAENRINALIYRLTAWFVWKVDMFSYNEWGLNMLQDKKICANLETTFLPLHIFCLLHIENFLLFSCCNALSSCGHHSFFKCKKQLKRKILNGSIQHKQLWMYQ